MKILVAVPTFTGYVRAELVPFLSLFDDQFFVFHRPVDVARNLIVAHAQLAKADVLFMADADAVPHPDTFDGLLNVVTNEVAVCGCPYRADGGAVPVFPDQPRDGLQRVENIGTHVVAYNVAAFGRISQPYFAHVYNDAHTVTFQTEDTACHERLRLAGVPLYCDWRLWAGHVKERIMDREHK